MLIKILSYRTRSVDIFYSVPFDKMNQKNRKNFAYAQTFPIVSTKHTAESNRKMVRVVNVEKHSSTLLFRGLGFENERQSSGKIDVLDVQAVPSNFVSISKPSAVVETLMRKRKNSHENSLEEMKKDLAAVHEECENEIRKLSTGIKMEIDNIHANIEAARRETQETDLTKLTDADLHNTWDSIKRSVAEKNRCIDEFHKSLKNIEHSRRPHVKDVMQKYYEIFHSISYISSFEIQRLLENEIQEYNRTVLSNFKVYEKLHFNMSIQMDNFYKDLQNWLEDIKKKRRDAISSENYEQLIRRKERLEQTEELFLFDATGLFSLKELNSKLNEIEEIISSWASTIVIFDDSSVNDCTKQLNETATQLNNSGTKVVESYKSALQKVSNQYEKEVEIFKTLNKTGFWEEDMERLDNGVNNLRDNYLIVTNKFKELWHQHMNPVQNSVEEICSFLRDFNSIWKTQTLRLSELQETTGRFVDDLTAKSEKIIAELEKKLIICSQQLREATNEEKMEQLLIQIFSTMDLICDKHKFSCDEEFKAVEKYVDNVFNEVPKITEQFDKFISSYDQNMIETSEENISTVSQDSEPLFVRQQLQTCRNLSRDISYWKTTLLKEIKAFCATFSETTEEKALEWQKIISSQRSSVLEAKLKADSQRREDIKTNIYNLRIQEIASHSIRLQAHKEEVNQVLKDTSNRLDNFLQEQKQLILKYEADISQETEQIPAGRSTTAIHRVHKEIDKIREDYNNVMEQKAKDFRAEVDSILESLANRNNDFLEGIKLFKDGGNFSVEEAKSYRQALTSCDKNITKSKVVNVQKMDKVCEELSKAIEKNYKTTVDSINSTTRELKFYEDAHKVLSKCAAIVERQVYRLLEDNTRFVNAVVENMEESNNKLCNNFNVQVLADQSIQLLELKDSRLDSLMIGFPIARDNSVNEQVKQSRKIFKANEKKKQKSVAKAANYRILFLGTSAVPSCEVCFSTAAMNTMLKTIDEIQALAMVFFSPNPKRRDSEASYRDYMQQILHQLHCYRDQLDDLWREEVKEMLAAAEAFERSTYGCILKSLNNFHSEHINEIISTKETKLRELKREIKVYITRREELYDTLNVSHGHPEKKDSLIQLTEQIMEEADKMEKAIDDKLNDNETELMALVSSYETALQDQAETLRKVLIKLEDHTKRQRLKTLLDERNRKVTPEYTSLTYELDLPEKTNRRRLKYKRNSKSAKTSSFDIEFVVNQFIENANEIYISAVEKWESEVNSFKETGEEFKQTWIRNIEIVAEVYETIL